MFGRRSDGRRLDNIDPIIQLSAYIMPKRNDAMNLVPQSFDYEPMAEYVKKCSKEGKKVTFLSLVIAAYVRVIAKYPELNRFVMNKQIFARNTINVSLAVLRNAGDKGNLDEALVKATFKPTDTVFEVSEQMERLISEAVKPDADNGAADIARKLIKCRPLVQLVVYAARVLDRYGLLPKMLYDVSPFHCSMFITHMGSLGLPAIYHHLYNFGNTSVFMSLGKIERQPTFSPNGAGYKNVIPVGVVTDERICGGAAYALGINYMKKLLANPEVLETPPETVNVDFDFSK